MDNINPKSFSISSFNGACQINNEDIIVFGGFDKEGETSDCFIFNMSKNREDFSIDSVNRKMLPFSCYFMNQVVLHDKHVFAIGKRKGRGLEVRLNFISYDGGDWVDLSDI